MAMSITGYARVSTADQDPTSQIEALRAGLDAARKAGRQIGRPPALTEEQKASARQLRAQGCSVAAIARVLGVSRATVRRIGGI